MATKKRAAKKRPVRKTATKRTPKRKASRAFLTPVRPDAKLAAVVGRRPLTRGQVTKKVWAYIKRHRLNDGRRIYADAALRPIFGVASLDMLKLPGKVNKHLR